MRPKDFKLKRHIQRKKRLEESDWSEEKRIMEESDTFYEYLAKSFSKYCLKKWERVS